MANSPTDPLAAFSEYRYLPSALIAMSMLVAPAGFTPTMVPGTAVNAPLRPIEKPAIDDVPALDTYANRPFGVTSIQQLAAPSVARLELIGVSIPFACIA